MIIDGKKEAAVLREAIKKEITSLKNKTNRVPGLTVILIGDFAPSEIYVRNKEKNSKEVGINSNVIKYANDVKQNNLSLFSWKIIRKCHVLCRFQLKVLRKFNDFAYFH